ncbi:hypothetical protein RHS01_00167 [Rhizoctonia solani]|uniref:F-box domain-containing protein n=1 Tax=Rhizoctonia solani TaxID=456999 RepID=A0A8H7ILX5_9AGAM|nr:hypothetical protein RHS01_00167 [Rhizoctonia solani]
MREYTKRAGGKSVTSRFEQSHVRLCFFMAKVYLFVQGPRSLLLPTAVQNLFRPGLSAPSGFPVWSAQPSYEILASVFGLLPPSNLALASRVCREWKKVAFQPLYHTVYLCLAVHLEQLAQRILTEDAASPTSVSAHLKGLAFDIKYMDEREEEMISEADIAHINAIIPHLAHLQSLSWNLMFVPQDPGTFQLFQTRCPKLTSVHIWIQDDIDFYGDQYTSLFGFKDLSHFSLSVRYLPSGFDTEQLEPLTSLLTRSPNISSLVLDLVSTDGESYYSPTALVSALVKIGSCPKPDSHPLRQFLIRHPGIEDIGFGLFEETEYGDVIDPAQVARLFPSLKHFEGPAFLFQPLVQSTLAEQIETLVILDARLQEGDIPLSNIYDKVSALPKLRKFGIWSSEIDEDILVNVLRTIVDAANQLEEVEIHADIESDYGEVMDLLAKLSNLRSVTFSESILPVFAENDDEEESDWDGLASKLRHTCQSYRLSTKRSFLTLQCVMLLDCDLLSCEVRAKYGGCGSEPAETTSLVLREGCDGRVRGHVIVGCLSLPTTSTSVYRCALSLFKSHPPSPRPRICEHALVHFLSLEMAARLRVLARVRVPQTPTRRICAPDRPDQSGTW